MDQTPLSAPPAGDPEPATSSTRHSRRRLVVPAAAAALALAVTGTGIGFAAGRHFGHPAGTAASAPTPGTSGSRQWLGYGGSTYGYGYGDAQGSFPDQGQQSAPQQEQQGSSTDTTSTASGSQLTGLVRIETTLKYESGKAAGTGMVLTSNGEVITNHHVVEGSTSIKATVLSTGKTYTAKVVGTDDSADVAVLQLVGASGLSTVTTDTGTVSTGDAVTAVGDGNGTATLSAATGSVLATGQSITTAAEGSVPAEQLTHLIEISSDVVSGYSGGATYDADGHVIGMTTAASSDRDPVGYAIPISTVLRVAQDLESGTQSSAYTYGYPAFLGVGLGSGTTPTVEKVYAGTPAAKAGITAGSTITRVDGVRTATATKLHSVVAGHQPGDTVTVTWRDSSGTSHSARVTLVAGPVA